jgi:nucleotide-binding universal stress UspA family protein
MSSSQAGPVVVGYDGSETANTALTWAAREAALRGRPLAVLRVFEWQWPENSLAGPSAMSAAAVDEQAIRRSAEVELDEAADRLHDTWPDVPITTKALDGYPAITLAAAARELEAEQIVIGRTEHLPMERLLVGSTASELAHDSFCPLVVVHADSAGVNFDRRGPVALGATGSGALSRATLFGLDFARRHRLPALAVHAVSSRSSDVDSEIDTWRRVHPELTIERLDVADKPQHALVDCAENAALLVVGSHGRGVVRRALQGSVSHHVLHNARCTVALVRDHAPVA